MVEKEGSWSSHEVRDSRDTELASWVRKHNVVLLYARHVGKRLARDVSRYWFYREGRSLVTGLITFGQTPDLARAAQSEPMLFICTNGARDLCCAREGISLRKAVHSAVNKEVGEQVWECTHLGGHRFAPTALYLPGNIVLGRLTVESVTQLLARGVVDPEHFRGRSHQSPCRQAIEASLRHTGMLTTTREEINVIDEPAQCIAHMHSHTVIHQGSSVEFHVEQKVTHECAVSCGKSPEQSHFWEVVQRYKASNFR